MMEVLGETSKVFSGDEFLLRCGSEEDAYWVEIDEELNRDGIRPQEEDE